ncbi:hypothetical protein [Prescottella equi]|uniref:hypothetical protein n=1 Tax=Rhodococcus hoagii TaxID=43767 RepID=UPI0007CD968B|nr:hypothetical protein [Prescottella equi]
MLVCDCGTFDRRHDYGCKGWREPETPAATFPSWALEARLDSTDDPWGWAARGITNPDKETQR